MKQKYLKVFAVVLSLMGGEMASAGGPLEELRELSTRLSSEYSRFRSDYEEVHIELVRVAREIERGDKEIRDIDARMGEVSQRLLPYTLKGRNPGLTAEQILDRKDVPQLTCGGIYPYVRYQTEGGVYRTAFFMFETDLREIDGVKQKGWSSLGGQLTSPEGSSLRAYLQEICEIAKIETAGALQLTPESLLGSPAIWDPSKKFLGIAVDISSLYEGEEAGRAGQKFIKSLSEHRQAAVDQTRLKRIGMTWGSSLVDFISRNSKGHNSVERPQDGLDIWDFTDPTFSSRKVTTPNFFCTALSYESKYSKEGRAYHPGGGRDMLAYIQDLDLSAALFNRTREVHELCDRQERLLREIENIRARLEQVESDRLEVERKLLVAEQEEAERLSMSPQVFADKYPEGVEVSCRDVSNHRDGYVGLFLNCRDVVLCEGLRVRLPGESDLRTVLTRNPLGEGRYWAEISGPSYTCDSETTVRLFGVRDEEEDQQIIDFTGYSWAHGVQGNRFLLHNTRANSLRHSDNPHLVLSREGTTVPVRVLEAASTGGFLHVYVEGDLSSVAQNGGWSVHLKSEWEADQTSRLQTVSLMREDASVVRNSLFARNRNDVLILPAETYVKLCLVGAQLTLYRGSDELIQNRIISVRYDDLADTLSVQLEGDVPESVQHITTRVAITGLPGDADSLRRSFSHWASASGAGWEEEEDSEDEEDGESASSSSSRGVDVTLADYSQQGFLKGIKETTGSRGSREAVFVIDPRTPDSSLFVSGGRVTFLPLEHLEFEENHVDPFTSLIRSVENKDGLVFVTLEDRWPGEYWPQGVYQNTFSVRRPSMPALAAASPAPEGRAVLAFAPTYETMEPHNLDWEDAEKCAIFNTNVGEDRLKVGDVVTFNPSGAGNSFTSRVIKIERTRGASARVILEDQWPVESMGKKGFYKDAFSVRSRDS